jgi:proteasome assembly chaperone (PAC2) family protein
MEFNITGIVIAFLLVIVLGLQVELNSLSRKSKERDEIISKKMDELLKEKEKGKEKGKEKDIKVTDIQF